MGSFTFNNRTIVAPGILVRSSIGAQRVLQLLPFGVIAMVGYLTSAFLGWLGLLRRGLLSTAWILLLTPVHWLLLSLAAWRALYQLAAAPYAWEKTEHELAKSSRRAATMTRSLVELERFLSALKESGDLPTLAPDHPASAADRQPHSRVAA